MRLAAWPVIAIYTAHYRNLLSGRNGEEFEFHRCQFLLNLLLQSEDGLEFTGLIREEAGRSRKLHLSLAPHCVHG